jgi:argininosuccinate lyase
MPLGSGAIAGTAYDIDVQFLADRLGFSRVTAQQHRRRRRSRLRRDVSLRVLDGDGAI